MAADSELLHDISPLLKLYKDGRVERFTGEEFVPPSLDPTTGVQSKDVAIAPETNLSARLYLPPNPTPATKLPLLVYFHGGAFVIESAFSPLYHKHLNHLVTAANAVAVSVNYRLAPEHPLPIAFDDSWLSLEWIAEQFTEKGNEDWIRNHADSNRVFLGGDSAGGNIVHNLAIRFGSGDLEGINLRGIFLNCPFFGGEDPIGGEDSGGMKKLGDRLWRIACPGVRGLDEPWINPGKDERVSGLGCRKVLVCVAEKDYLKERGWYYKEVLGKSEWGGEVECVEVAGEGHVFSVFSPDSENGAAMLKKVASFIHH